MPNGIIFLMNFFNKLFKINFMKIHFILINISKSFRKKFKVC